MATLYYINKNEPSKKKAKIPLSKGKIYFEDQPGYICSELMCELLENIGIMISKLKYLVRPDDIVKALELYGFTRA